MAEILIFPVTNLQHRFNDLYQLFEWLRTLRFDRML